MPVTYIIDTTRKLIHTKCSGAVTLADVVEHFGKLEDDPACAGHLDVMLDVREAESVPESNQLKIVNSSITAIRARVAFGMCAIVVNRDAMFGMMRMFGVFAERNFRAIRVFRGTAAAEAWLTTQETRSLS
jgi:hypothetical protein